MAAERYPRGEPNDSSSPVFFFFFSAVSSLHTFFSGFQRAPLSLLEKTKKENYKSHLRPFFHSRLISFPRLSSALCRLCVHSHLRSFLPFYCFLASLCIYIYIRIIFFFSHYRPAVLSFPLLLFFVFSPFPLFLPLLSSLLRCSLVSPTQPSTHTRELHYCNGEQHSIYIVHCISFFFFFYLSRQ